MEVKKISGIQFMTILFFTIIATAILFVPSITAQKARQSAWLASSILPLGIGVITLYMVIKLAGFYPGQSLAQYSESIFGKILGKLVAMLYTGFFLFGNILIIREFAEFLAVEFLPGTPVLVLATIEVASAAYVVMKGPEVFCRMAQFILPLYLLTFIVLILFAIPDMSLERIRPFFEGGVWPILEGSLTPASWYGEIVVATVLIPHLNKPKEAMLKGTLALVGVMFVLTINTVATLSVFGPDFTGLMMFPFLSLVKNIKISEVLQRLDVFFMGIWITGMILKVTVFYFVSYQGVTQVFKEKGKKIILISLGVIQVAAATYLFENSLDLLNILGEVWTIVALIFEVGILAFILAVAYLKNNLKKKQKS